MARVEFNDSQGNNVAIPANCSCCFAGWCYVFRLVSEAATSATEAYASKDTEIMATLSEVMSHNWDTPGEMTMIRPDGETITITVTDDGTSECNATHDPVAPDDLSELGIPA